MNHTLLFEVFVKNWLSIILTDCFAIICIRVNTLIVYRGSALNCSDDPFNEIIKGA